MAVSHAKSITIGDFTGTVTAFNSQASTTTVAATDLARPADWNSAHNQYFTLTGNTNNASTVSGTNIVLSGANNITLIGSNSVIGISGPAGAAAGTATMWWPFNEGVNVTGNQGANSLVFVPVPTPTPAAGGGVVHVDRLCLPIYYSNASNSSGSVSLSMAFGLYTKNGSSLSLAYSTTGSTSIAFASNNSSQSFRGIRLYTIPWTTTIDEGRYYVGVVSNTTSGGQNATMAQILVSQLNSSYSGIFGVSNDVTQQWPLGMGRYSTTTNALPGSIHFSQIQGNSSIFARPPSWFMVSGTV